MPNLKQRFSALEASGAAPGALTNLLQLRLSLSEGHQVDEDLIESLEKGLETLYDRKPEAMQAAIARLERDYPELYALHADFLGALRTREPEERAADEDEPEDPAVPLWVLTLLVALIGAGAAYAFVPGVQGFVHGLLGAGSP